MSTPDLRYAVRPELPEDEAGIRRVHEEAFGRPDEADLVDHLREKDNLLLSLVAVAEGRIIGHVAFSPVVIEPGEGGMEPFRAVGLAPVGVLPEHQGKGVGSALVRAGCEECERRGSPLVILLGHPEYYGRFGFVPAKPFGVEHPFGPDVPDEAFMLRFAGENFPANARGLVRYAPEFDGLA